MELQRIAITLDGDRCMKVAALKGTGAELQHFADHIIAERGVRYGRMVMIPTGVGKKTASTRKRTGHRN
jgi:CopG family nickel-responsive transcriptional regulator